MEKRLPLPTDLQAERLLDRPQDFTPQFDTIAVNRSPAVGQVTVEESSAVEIFAGSTEPLEYRERLVIYNPDPAIAVRVGGSGLGRKEGYILEPLGTVVITFDESAEVDIFARSTGYAVTLEVFES